jgi:hypothetical protein
MTMETYYNPEDLLKFGDIGKDSPNLAKKFFEDYEAVFGEGVFKESIATADHCYTCTAGAGFT